ncbi:MAG: zinc ribbon domain-containing protein [Eubacteriales bacterium]|uniref:zinc ribbon domain-containing protein n=1 Tax=Fenollaria sp. TaxID=1965292 RepID=UPI002A749B95|nr:zinc ribbon domain-containing protein [Fenollaria sp.]MDD7339097.1 zinc ribbon domain-containing protein [Eubacteriales bacterium]MDY3105749.1 zinc ribbon domain-containing protein [Fenollaria sp.]
MKKLILIVLIIALSITQMSVLGKMAPKAEEKSNKAVGNFYSAEYSVDQLKKLTGAADYVGIKKAIEDINTNYIYKEEDSEVSTLYDSKKDIYKINIYFTDDVKSKTLILCCGKLNNVLYACSEDKFEKMIVSYPYADENNVEYSADSSGAYIDNQFYFYMDATMIYDNDTGLRLDRTQEIYTYKNDKIVKVSDSDLAADSYQLKIQNEFGESTFTGKNCELNLDKKEYFYFLGTDGLYLDADIFSDKYEKDEVKKIFSSDSFYNLNYFKNVKKEELDKIAFIGSTYSSKDGTIRCDDIANWIVYSPLEIYAKNSNRMLALTGEYNKIFNEFAQNYVFYNNEEYFDLEILNNYTKKFFGVVLNSFDYDGILNIKDNKFTCNLPSTEYYIWNQGVCISDFTQHYNYAIIKVDDLSYGKINSKYILVEKKHVDGENKLFPIYIKKEPFTFEEAENALGSILTPDFLSGFDKEEALKKNSSQELISYIDSFIKQNEYSREIGLSNGSQYQLVDVFKNFDREILSYNINGAVEFNKDFYDSHKVDRDDVINLRNYLSNLDIKYLSYYKPVVHIKMKPNEVGKYIFSFKDELKDDVIYNFYLDGLDINVILTKDDINKLKEKNTTFAIENFDGNVFITPLSKKRTTLPINLTIIFSEVPEDKYISKVPTLYYLMNDEILMYKLYYLMNDEMLMYNEMKFNAVYTNHYGPIKFEDYECKQLEDVDYNNYWKLLTKNILSSKILSEASDSLALDEPLTKGELARAVGFLLGDYDDDKDIKLDDVNEADKIYIKSALKHKLFNYEGSNFYPNEKVKRAQLVYVLTEVLKLNGLDIKDDELSEAKGFSDFDKFKSIEKNVELALESEIIYNRNQDEKLFNADEVVNIDEAVLLLYRTLAIISTKTVIENTNLEDFEAEKTLLSNVTNRLSEPKIEEMNNLNSFIFIESESFLDKLEDLFENKIILILTILIVIIIIALIIFLILKKKKNKKTIKDDKSKNLVEEKFIEEEDEEVEVEEDNYIEEDITKEDEIKFCSNCGAEYNGENFCSKCGYDFRKNQ